MQSYRENITPPRRLDETAAAQGRRGKAPIILDERKLAEWSQMRLMGFSEEKLAILHGCSVPQIRRELRREPYRTIWARGPIDLELALLRRQVALTAIKGAAGVDMAKWLGKQYLGQADRMELAPSSTPAVEGAGEIRRVEFVVVHPGEEPVPIEDMRPVKTNGQAAGQNGPISVKYEIVDP